MNSTEALDLQTWPIFHKMSRRGLLVSFEKFEELAMDVEGQIEEQREILNMLAEDLNPSSPVSVGTWLRANGFHTKTTPSGQSATDERSLSQLPKHPVIDAILEWRGLNKMLSTFIDPTIRMAQKDPAPGGGVVHPKWRLTKVKSGRVATEDPNLLAFPSRTEMGKKVRSCFVARPGFKMLSVDYSQLEPRIVAALSGDPDLLRIFDEDRDLYTEIAARIGVTRTVAKTLTLGILYGMAAKRLYEQLVLAGCVEGNPPIPTYDIDACGELIERWFAMYPSVKKLVRDTTTSARRDGGWVKTVGGRGRLLPGLYLEGQRWPSSKLREEAERQAFNHVIQGTGMECLKHAMVRVDRSPVLTDVHPLLAIHDELIFEIPEKEAEETKELVAFVVFTVFQAPHSNASVRLKVSSSLGDDWGSLK